MKIAVLVAALVAAPAVASAQFMPMPQLPGPQTTYDPESGNTYTTTRRPGGGADINGFNAQTGSMWNSHIDQRGNANGFDSQGRMWNSTPNGTYMRSDGRTCIGTGATRTCTGGGGD